MALTSPYDILSAYSEGRISAAKAIDMLHLDGVADLMLAMFDAGHKLPTPPQAELEEQARRALPLLRAALLPNDA